MQTAGGSMPRSGRGTHQPNVQGLGELLRGWGNGLDGADAHAPHLQPVTGSVPTCLGCAAELRSSRPTACVGPTACSQLPGSCWLLAAVAGHVTVVKSSLAPAVAGQQLLPAAALQGSMCQPRTQGVAQRTSSRPVVGMGTHARNCLVPNATVKQTMMNRTAVAACGSSWPPVSVGSAAMICWSCTVSGHAAMQQILQLARPAIATTGRRRGAIVPQQAFNQQTAKGGRGDRPLLPGDRRASGGRARSS